MNITPAFLCVMLLSYCPWSSAQSASAQQPSAQSASAPQPSPPMEAVFKNIQVLQGIPSDQLGPIMHFMRSSLGVRCEFCHVAEERMYRLDEKKPKQRAREMILMTRRLNAENFGGQAVVTCNTCHNGAIKP